MSLRKKLVRLAYTQPQLRDDLLPLLTKSAKKDTFDEWVKDKKFPNPNPKKRNKIKFKSLPKEDQKKIREDWTKAKEKADAEKEAKKPPSWKAFDKMFKKLDPDVSEALPSPDQMDEWGQGDTLAEKYELWLEDNDWAKQFGSHGEDEFSDAHIISDWIDDHASKWEEETGKEEDSEEEDSEEEEEEDKGSKKATLRSSLIRLAYSQPQLRDDLLPLIKSAGNKSIGFALSFSPLDIAEKEQEIESIISRKFKGSLRDYNYFVNTSVGDVPVLYISDSKGNGVSGTMFNNDWRDVIQALVRAKYLSVANFQKGIALAMRQKAYIPDA